MCREAGVGCLVANATGCCWPLLCRLLGNIIGDMIKVVVLDTNILVAASRSREGASFALLKALREARFVALASVPLMLEYEAVFSLQPPRQLPLQPLQPAASAPLQHPDAKFTFSYRGPQGVSG